MTTLTSTMIVRLLDKVSGPAKGVASALTGIGRAARSLNGSMSDRLGVAIERNNRSLERARGAMLDAVAGAYALQGAYKGTIGAAVDFESVIADIGKVSGFDDAALANYGKELRAIATKEIPMAVTELAALSEQAASAGIPDDQLATFTRMAAKAGVAWGVTGAVAGENLAKIQTSMNLTIDQTRLYGDAINFVADKLAASAPQMLDFSRRVAVQGEFFGYTKEQTLAFGGAMVSAGFEADVAATSFRNMGRALTKGSSSTERQEGAFAKLGMSSRKVAKAMQKDAVGTTLKVIDAIKKVPAHMQAALISDLFGDEAAALIPLLKNTDKLREAIALTADQQNYANSVGKEFEKRAATSAFRIQMFKNRIGDLGLAIGGIFLPALNDALEAMGPYALKATELAEAHPDLVKKLTYAAAGFTGLRIAMLASRFAALQVRGTILSLASPLVSLGTWAATAATQQVALQRALGAMSGQKLTGLQTAGTALMGIARAVPGVALLGSAASGIGAAVAALTAPAWLAIAAGVAAVGAAGGLVYYYWDRITSVLAGVGRAIGEQLQPALATMQPVLDRLAPVGDTIAAGWDRAKAAIASFGEGIGTFFSREVLSEGQKAAWETAGYDVATRMIEAVKAKIGELVDWFKGLPGRIRAAIGSIDLTSVFRIPSLRSLLGIGRGEEASATNDTAAQAVDGARAAGGPVRRGGLYLVGEEGPELFAPDAPGSIAPNSETMALLRNARSGSPGGASQPASRVLAIEKIDIRVDGSGDPLATARAIGRHLSEVIHSELQGALAND